MDLTLAEFACFSLKSKQQILDYKAVQISSILLDNNDELLLYSMNSQFVTVQIDNTSKTPVNINPLVNQDMLYLFSNSVDISGLLN